MRERSRSVMDTIDSLMKSTWSEDTKSEYNNDSSQNHSHSYLLCL